MPKISKKVGKEDFNKKINLIFGLIVLVLGILILFLPSLLRILVGVALLFWAFQILFPLMMDYTKNNQRRK
jgi:uncharacterized membrane protein